MTKWTRYRFAPWGPLRVEEDKYRTTGTAAGSGVVEIRARQCHWIPDPGTLSELETGLPVTLDGVETFTLRQDPEDFRHGRNRVVHVSGPAEVVPPGCFLRPRWQYSIGLETPERRLIRPRFDMVPWIPRPRIDADVGPDLLALWWTASFHLGTLIR